MGHAGGIGGGGRGDHGNQQGGMNGGPRGGAGSPSGGQGAAPSGGGARGPEGRGGMGGSPKGEAKGPGPSASGYGREAGHHEGFGQRGGMQRGGWSESHERSSGFSRQSFHETQYSGERHGRQQTEHGVWGGGHREGYQTRRDHHAGIAGDFDKPGYRGHREHFQGRYKEHFERQFHEREIHEQGIRTDRKTHRFEHDRGPDQKTAYRHAGRREWHGQHETRFAHTAHYKGGIARYFTKHGIAEQRDVEKEHFLQQEGPKQHVSYFRGKGIKVVHDETRQAGHLEGREEEQQQEAGPGYEQSRVVIRQPIGRGRVICDQPEIVEQAPVEHDVPESPVPAYEQPEQPEFAPAAPQPVIINNNQRYVNNFRFNFGFVRQAPVFVAQPRCLRPEPIVMQAPVCAPRPVFFGSPRFFAPRPAVFLRRFAGGCIPQAPAPQCTPRPYFNGAVPVAPAPSYYGGATQGPVGPDQAQGPGAYDQQNPDAAGPDQSGPDAQQPTNLCDFLKQEMQELSDLLAMCERKFNPQNGPSAMMS